MGSSSLILGIGLSKTGTKSLNRALQLLKYNSMHLPSEEMLFSGYYEAFTDIPTIAYFEQIIKQYKIVKLIETSRLYESWLNSCKKHFKITRNEYFLQLRKKVYGSLSPKDKEFKETYYQHRNWINKLGKKYPLIKLPIEANDNQKWELLCNFLGKNKPNYPYPYII